MLCNAKKKKSFVIQAKKPFRGDFLFTFSSLPNPSNQQSQAMATVTIPLPALPSGWTAEKDFKALGKLSEAVQRSIEPVGPHFLAHARRARHKRTFSEDDRIQAQESAKKVEDDNESDVSEPEDAMLLQREAKDWKVRTFETPQITIFLRNQLTPSTVPGPLQGSRYLQVPMEGH